MKKKFSKKQKQELLDAIELRTTEHLDSEFCPLCREYKSFQHASHQCGSKCPANKVWRDGKTYCIHFLEKRQELEVLLREMYRSVRGKK